MPKKEVFSLELNVDANITQSRNAATQLRDAFAKINLSDSLKGSLEKTFTNLEKELANFEGMANKPFTNMKDVQKAEKSYERIVDLFNELSIQGKNISGMDPNKFLPKEIINRINTLQTSLKNVRTTINNTNKAIESQNREYNQASQQQINYQNKIKETEGAIKSYQGSLGATTKALNDTQKKQSELTQKQQEYLDNGGKKSDPQYQQLGRELSALQKQYAGLSSTQNSYRKQIGELKADLNGYVASEKAAGESAQEHKEKVDKLKQSLQNPQGLTELREEISKLSGTPLDQITTDTDELEKEITKLSQAQLKQISEDLKLVGDKSKDISNTANSVGDLDKKVDELGNDAGKLTETAAEIERLGNQVKQFFSIGNTIQLFKRAVRDAMNTVKELDATMTETATVTDFSISDMWEQLPRYTDEANKLGTSINSLYKATTLYYQQGLETNEAMALGIETIKMARVANMDAAQATDLMTAALRGFNMELNETSAIRVNDVYSELAAVTAADTDEIGIAISKTASIAHSANMEFETTAAFLSQIIETTREAPETAGTAMKTIIARFSEVKKLYSEGQILGTDEEGEAINVNKIQEALRTVGIDMTKFFVGAEGLDDVLLRLAEKWDTLDIATQRYIATQAAGSRQQSRFLAMMGDYDRTIQLVDAAYDSAGSGQAQFEKTLDSMQAKLAELKNAWDQFVMGLANNEILKAGVDTLTSILSTINDIISAVSGNNGLIKSIISLGSAFLALRGGSKLFGSEKGGGFIGKIFGALKGKNIEDQAKKTGTEIGKELGENIGNGLISTKEKIKNNFSSFFSKENFGIGVTGTKKLEKINYKKIDRDKFEDIIANNAAGLGGTLTTDQIQVARVEFETNGAEAGIKALQDFGAEIKVTKQGIQDWDKAASAVGQTLVGVGAAVTALGALVSKSNEEAGQVITTIGTVITSLGGVVSVIPGVVSGIKAISSALSVSSGVIGVVIAATGALIGLFVLLANSTPEKQLERAQKKAEESAKAAQEAQQAYDDLLSNRNNYNELEEKVASLTKGTQEWTDAVAELNSKILELVQNYEGLEIVYDSEGNMSISKESWNKVEQQQKTKTDKATATALSDRINAARTKVDVAKNNASAVGSDGQVYEDWELRNLRNSMGQISDEDWEDYLESQEIKIVPTVDLSEADKELEIARKNMILAFMPDSVDKKQANQVGKALTTLIGDAIDNETDPDTIQGIVDKYYAGYNKLTDEQKALLAGDFSKIESGSVAFNDETREALVEATGRTKEEIDTIISDAQKEYKAKLEETNKELERLGLGNLDVFGDKETGMALADKTRDMGFQDARAYVRAWKEVAADNPELAKDLLNFDTSNLSGVVNTVQTMMEKGIDQTKIDNYWKTATAGANNFEIKLSDILNTAKAAQEELKGIAELGERMGKGTMTDEDVTQYLSHGGNMDNLMWTAEGWQLVGESAEEAMKRERAALLQEQEIELKVLKDRQEALKGTKGISKQAEILGIKTDDFTDEKGIFDFEAWKKAIKDAIAELPQQIEVQTKVVAGISAIQNSAIENEAQGRSEQSIVQSAQNEAQQAGFNSTELDEYAIALQNINTNLENDKTTAYEVALGNMKLNAGLGEIIDSYNEWSGLIDKSSGKIKATTSEDVKVFNELKKSVNKMLNTSEDLSEKFWDNTKNIENLTKAAKGDTKALGELQKAAGEDYLINIDMSDLSDTAKSDIQTFLDYYKSIDIPPLEPGVDMSAVWSGADEFTEAFNIMAQQANLSSEQIMKAAQNMGFDAKVKYVKQTRRLPIYEQTEQKIDNGDGTATIKSGTPRITGYEDVEGYFPVVETFTPIGTGGGGISTGNIGKTSGNKKGGGGGSSKKQNNWKNPYDKYYNLTEKINEALRTREKIERDYDRILKRRERSVADILKNSEAEIKNLKQEVQYQKQLQAGRLDQLKNVASEKYDDDGTLRTFKDMGATKYARYNFDEQRIEIDWEAIDKVRDERLGKAIEAYVSRLEELQGQFEETQTTIEEMEDNIWEINQRGKQEYLDLEQRVIDALVNEQQKIIDDLSAKFESINEANDNILNSMQEQIDLERQIRDNTKTEDDIAQKEARLAYLRRDTSGANATEIMKLEQDLADARQNYTDTLIDQGLQKLSDENAKAAEQRQQQIDVMQAQLNFQKENGGFNEQAATILKSAFDTNGNLKNNSALVNLLKSADNFKSLTEFGQIQWWTDLTTAVKAAIEGGVNFAKEKYNNKNSTLTVKNKNGEEAQIYWNKSKNAWVDAEGNTYDEVNTVTGTYGSMTAVSTPSNNSNNNGSNANSSNNTETYPYGKASETTGNIGQNSKDTKGVKAIQYALQKLGYDIGSSGVDGKFGPKTKAAVQKFQKDMGFSKKDQDGIVGKNTRAKFKTKGYATGGLADFTGPAWLDGTKAHPELVLNARDTENFIQLKDILSGMGSLDKLQNGGDNYYNFDIKVDQLASDYDVDKLIGKIKNEIDKDARYRNVNSINFIR